MKWVARSMAFKEKVYGARLGFWLVLLWLAPLIPAAYVNLNWRFVSLGLFVLTGVCFLSVEETPEEKAQALIELQLDRLDWQRRYEVSPEYRAEQVERALYERAQFGDVQAMQAYLQRQQWRASHPQRRIGAYGESDMFG